MYARKSTRKIRSDKKPRIERVCKVCGKLFYITAYDLSRRKHEGCCFEHGQLIRRTRIKIECAICKKELYKLPSDKDKKYCSMKCRSLAYSRDRKGDKTHLWKGGITSEYLLQRSRKESVEWRKKVFERDNYTCQVCGDNRGHNLNAHHLSPFKTFTLLRYDLNNGLTVCRDCHKVIHKNKGVHPKWEEQWRKQESYLI